MTAPYLLLDYLACREGQRGPALLAWFHPATPLTLGLGVHSGHSFDPRPFIAAFPDDAREAWVFAEWAFVLDDMLRDGADVQEVRDWVGTAQPSVLVVSAEGQTDNPADLAPVAPSLASAAGATEAVRFVLNEATDGAVRYSSGVGFGSLRPDLVITDAAGQPSVLVEVKTRSVPGEMVCQAALYAVDGHRLGQVDVNAPELERQLRRLLEQAGSSGP